MNGHEGSSGPVYKPAGWSFHALMEATEKRASKLKKG
jgi:hypothetical protein